VEKEGIVYQLVLMEKRKEMRCTEEKAGGNNYKIAIEGDTGGPAGNISPPSGRCEEN